MLRNLNKTYDNVCGFLIWLLQLPVTEPSGDMQQWDVGALEKRSCLLASSVCRYKWFVSCQWDRLCVT